MSSSGSKQMGLIGGSDKEVLIVTDPFAYGENLDLPVLIFKVKIGKGTAASIREVDVVSHVVVFV